MRGPVLNQQVEEERAPPSLPLSGFFKTHYLVHSAYYCASVSSVLLDYKENEYGLMRERKQLLSQLKDHYNATSPSSMLPLAEEEAGRMEVAPGVDGEEGWAGGDGCPDPPLVVSRETALEQFRADYSHQVSVPPLEVTGGCGLEKVCVVA